MKHFLLGSLTAIVVFAFGAFGYLELGFASVAADEVPSALETSFMTSAVHASVRRLASQIPNSIPASDATLIAGGKIYMDDCVGCHGAPGQPPSHFGDTFFPRVPQFPAIGSRLSTAQLFWVAKHGIRMSGMYAQSPGYSDAKLWSLAAFIGRIRNLPPGVVRAVQEPVAGQ